MVDTFLASRELYVINFESALLHYVRQCLGLCGCNKQLDEHIAKVDMAQLSTFEAVSMRAISWVRGQNIPHAWQDIREGERPNDLVMQCLLECLTSVSSLTTIDNKLFSSKQIENIFSMVMNNVSSKTLQSETIRISL